MSAAPSPGSDPGAASSGHHEALPVRGEPLHSVVVPVYGNEATIPALLDRLADLHEALGGSMEAVFVVDGSPDGSLLVLRRLLPDAPHPSQLITHSRNFGSFAAIRTGLAAARGEYVAAMAADLQEPAELVLRFFEHLRSGEHDVAVGTREGRDDPRVGMVLSQLFWRVYRRYVNPEIPAGGVDIFACTRPVATRLVALEESHSSLVGLLYWLGYRRVEVPYRRAPRQEGRSGWSFRRKVRYLLDSIFSFTDVPVMVLTAVGLVGGLLTLAASLVVLVARLTGVIQQAGYTPLMLVMLLSTFVLLFGLGIVGSYVWRTYENSKGRPPSVPMGHEHFAPPPAERGRVAGEAAAEPAGWEVGPNDAEQAGAHHPGAAHPGAAHPGAAHPGAARVPPGDAAPEAGPGTGADSAPHGADGASRARTGGQR